ncbi:MAG: hypothetical protein PHU93_00160 [Candidatus Gracilibacteria bacterium]|nr:hypothetical protein [Candidatus Gracilibacteria bacterium]
MSQDLEALIRENTELRRKLEVSRAWMEREVRESAHRISQKRVGKMSIHDRDDFLGQNQEEIITNRIRGYFGELLLLNAPKNTVEHLVDSEISYFSLGKNVNGDGIGVISSYTKIIDSLIETIITNQFRKFVSKQGAIILRSNDPLEKALYLVISKKYILSTGRLYGLLKNIRSGGTLLEFGGLFAKYLEKYQSLGDFLLSDAFFHLYAKLIEDEVFGGKRHSGKISREETLKVRELLVGNFTDKNAILYQFLAQNCAI